MRQLVLVKHAQPILEAELPPRAWQLSVAGERQASELAERLRPYLPFHLFTSPEPKARRTCELVTAALGLSFGQDDDLRELDRRAGPILSDAGHRDLNRAIFQQRDRAVAGAESANAALARFAAAVQKLATGEENVVVITHGTVISLFVASCNTVDAFAVWQDLACGEFVVLRMPDYRLIAGAPGREPAT